MCVICLIKSTFNCDTQIGLEADRTDGWEDGQIARWQTRDESWLDGQANRQSMSYHHIGIWSSGCTNKCVHVNKSISKFLRKCWGKKDTMVFTANLQVFQGHVPSLQTWIVELWWTDMRTEMERQTDRPTRIREWSPSISHLCWWPNNWHTRFEDKIVALYMKHSTYGGNI